MKPETKEKLIKYSVLTGQYAYKGAVWYWKISWWIIRKIFWGSVIFLFLFLVFITMFSKRRIRIPHRLINKLVSKL